MVGKYDTCIHCKFEFFYKATENSVECPNCMRQTPVEPTDFDMEQQEESPAEE